ncbi:MAG: hypothetical protein HQ517_10775 [SAR324 cluster bacterium]|nr:hypothetical protein [SAR324 cluster bacterium]
MAKPSYSRKILRQKIESGEVDIRGNALEGAYSCFRWEKEDIEKCLLKLKPMHCYKTVPHWICPDAMMDFYRAENIMEGNDVFTHFYIHPNTERLIISSFKDLNDDLS